MWDINILMNKTECDEYLCCDVCVSRDTDCDNTLHYNDWFFIHLIGIELRRLDVCV